VVKRYGEAVRYRRFESIGVYAVRQAMLGELRGEWFLNLDADNWIEPDFLEKALAVTARHVDDPAFAFVYPDIRRFGDVNDMVVRPEFDVATLKRGNYIDMNSLIRLDAAREAGFDPAFNDGQGDYDFFLTLAERGYTGARLPGGLLHYAVHTGSITHGGRTRFRHLELAEKILAKHAEFFTPAEAALLRRGARGGACRSMWRTAEEAQAEGYSARAVRLGWRAVRFHPRGTTLGAAALFLRSLLAWAARGFRRDMEKSESSR